MSQRHSQWRPEQHPRDARTGRFVPRPPAGAGQSTSQSTTGAPAGPATASAVGQSTTGQSMAGGSPGTHGQGGESASMGAGVGMARGRGWHAGQHPRDPATGRFVPRETPTGGQAAGSTGAFETAPVGRESTTAGATPQAATTAAAAPPRQGTAMRRREWNPEQHPRDPRTGRFVRRRRGWLRRYFG